MSLPLSRQTKISLFYPSLLQVGQGTKQILWLLTQIKYKQVDNLFKIIIFFVMMCPFCCHVLNLYKVFHSLSPKKIKEKNKSFVSNKCEWVDFRRSLGFCVVVHQIRNNNNFYERKVLWHSLQSHKNFHVQKKRREAQEKMSVLYRSKETFSSKVCTLP